MSDGLRISAGRPRIDFRVHQLRHGEGGAPYDFENMLAALIEATYGDAHLSFTHKGDWGIDVLRGDLNGKVTVWQAKYFLRAVESGQLDKIKKSLKSAIEYSKDHGYHIDEWILCLPTSMTAEMYQKWQSQVIPLGLAEGVVVTLWDETQLADLLHKDAAAHVRKAYYEPYQDRLARTDEPRLRVRPAVPDRTVWRGGQEIRLGSDRYLLYDPVTEWRLAGGHDPFMRATAARLDEQSRLTVLQGIRAEPAGGIPEAIVCGLETQAALLREIGGRRGLPRLVAVYDEDDLFAYACERPAGATWAEMFGSGQTPLDRLVLPMAASVAGSLVEALGELHQRGHSHRALDASCVVLGSKSRATVRDLGLAGLPEPIGEMVMPYRAPEQRMLALGEPGPATDIYQLAALFLHTLTGVPMSGVGMPAVLPHDFPAPAREAFERALGSDPRERPKAGELSRVFTSAIWHSAEVPD